MTLPARSPRATARPVAKSPHPTGFISCGWSIDQGCVLPTRRAIKTCSDRHLVGHRALYMRAISTIRMKIEELSQRVSAFLPEIFLIIGLPMVLFFVFAVPPFQVPDEYAHLLRADQLFYGDMIGTRLNDTSSGGYVETSYRLLYEAFETLGEPKDKIEKADTIPLRGIREFSSFPNTVRYGPLTYIPQVAALVIARAAGIKAIQAFYLARCFNGFAALVMAFLALRLAKRGRFLFFCILTMPMVFFLMGSVSQDALLIAGSAFFLAITSRVLSAKRPPSAATYV
jgi:uncharacterized membrane protein